MRPDLCQRCRLYPPHYYCRGCRRYICSDCKALSIGMSTTQAQCVACMVARRGASE